MRQWYENIFLYLTDNFSFKNYNTHPATYENLMFNLGRYVLNANKDFSNSFKLSIKNLVKLNEREKSLLTNILKVLKISFEKNLNFTINSIEFLSLFIKSVKMDEGFYDDTISVILCFFQKIVENSSSLIISNQIFWKLLSIIVLSCLEAIEK